VWVPARPIDWLGLGVSASIILAVLALSSLYFSRAEDAFNDIL
jgi:hypothetical protein